MRYDSVGIIREAQMVMSQMGHHLGAFPRASSSPSDENHPLSLHFCLFSKVGMADAHLNAHKLLHCYVCDELFFLPRAPVSGPFGDPAYSLSPTHDKRPFSIIPRRMQGAPPPPAIVFFFPLFFFIYLYF